MHNPGLYSHIWPLENINWGNVKWAWIQRGDTNIHFCQLSTKGPKKQSLKVGFWFWVAHLFDYHVESYPTVDY